MHSLMETYKEEPHQVVDGWEPTRKNKRPANATEKIENMLQEHGLTKNEAKVYLHLARSKERKAGEISEALKLHRTDTYRTLQDLEKKGLVSSVFEKPLKFIATPFDRAVDALIEAKKLRIQRLERKRKALMELWQSLPKSQPKDQRKEVFQILEGEEQIDLKATEIIQNAQREIKVYASEEDLPGFYHSGFIETLEKLAKKKPDIKFLTNDSPKSRFFAEKMKLLNKRLVRSENNAVPSFILADQKRVVVMIRKFSGENGRKTARPKIAALWTNYEAFIKALGALFAELWSGENKIGIEEKEGRGG
jgi:sugar-specific transcriptional regulator TrmB